MMNARDIPPHFHLEDYSVTSTSAAGPSSQPYSQFNMDHPYSNPIPLEDEDETEENMFRDMTFDEVLEDLNARFLLNLPKEEMTLVRMYWQAEQAHWFYEDYLRPLNPHLPSLGQRHFTQLIIASSPIYASLAGPEGIDYDGVWSEYISYKSMVPCCGGILLNQDGDKCLMVRGWKSSAGWCFPRGKININEPEVECAIREVEEEVGFDLTGRINEKDQIQTQINAQVVTMFIVPGIDESTTFEAQTRKEIGLIDQAIEWVNLTDLPTWTGKRLKKTEGKTKKFYNVTPFVGPLKRWLQQNGYNPHPNPKKLKQPSQPSPQSQHQHPTQLRALQPFFDSSAPSQTMQSHKPSSALDSLFDRFITKQEEDLRSGSADGQRAGLERLFGNLEIRSSASEVGAMDRKTKGTREQQEEEDLARLLGGVGYQAVEKQVAQPKDDKANKLLSLLRPMKDELSRPEEGVRTSIGSPTHQPLSTNIRPHQASLLSMLASPPSQVPFINSNANAQHHLPINPVPTSSTLFPTSHSAQNIKPISLPTSPRPPSADEKEAERREKQRRLLEMTIAGMGLDSSAPAQPNHIGGSIGQGNWGNTAQPGIEGTAGVYPGQVYTGLENSSNSPTFSGVATIYRPAPQGISPPRGNNSHYSPTKSQHSSGTAHTRQPSSSPTKRGLYTNQPGQPETSGYTGYPGQPAVIPSHLQQPSHHPNTQFHNPTQGHRPPLSQYPPPDPVQQQRLLGALHARPLPAVHNTGYTGYRPPVQQYPSQQIPGQAVRGYQMGVPGQPGQPGQVIPNNTLVGGGKMNQPYPQGQAQIVPNQNWQNHSHNPGWNSSQPPPQSQPRPGPIGYRPNNPPHAPMVPTHTQPPPMQQPNQQPYPPYQPQQPVGAAAGQYQPRPPAQGHGQTGTGTGTGVLQPVPKPRGAALGLLAMINGDSGR